MRLFSVQPKDVYEQIMNEGVYICNPSKSEYISDSGNNFLNAYKWLIKKMNEKISNPQNIEFPVWAWYKIDGKNSLPYFNDPLINYTDQYLLEIEIPDKDVVLTDYDLWHMPLNNCYANMEENDDKWEEKNKWFDSLPFDEKEKVRKESWNCIFDDAGKYIQATFWQLKKESLVNAFKIYKSIDLEDVIFYVEDGSCTEEDRIKRGFTKENLPQLLANYLTNSNNYSKALNINKNGKSLEDLINNNRNNLSDKEYTNINKIIKLYGLEDKNIIR